MWTEGCFCNVVFTISQTPPLNWNLLFKHKKCEGDYIVLYIHILSDCQIQSSKSYVSASTPVSYPINISYLLVINLENVIPFNFLGEGSFLKSLTDMVTKSRTEVRNEGGEKNYTVGDGVPALRKTMLTETTSPSALRPALTKSN